MNNLNLTLEQIDTMKTMKHEYMVSTIKNKVYRQTYHEKPDVVEHIHSNFNKILDNDVFAFNLFKQIINPAFVIKHLLEYELLCHVPDKKISDISVFINTIQCELKKYQGIVGGYDIEDDNWIVSDNTQNGSGRFKLTDKQKCIYNTVEQAYSNSSLRSFLEKFTDYIKRYADENIELKCKIIDDDDNEISWIVFIITEIPQLQYLSDDEAHDDQIDLTNDKI